MIVSKAVHTDSQLSPERFAKAAYTECVLFSGGSDRALPGNRSK
jgi:hypothetical protein